MKAFLQSYFGSVTRKYGISLYRYDGCLVNQIKISEYQNPTWISLIQRAMNVE